LIAEHPIVMTTPAQMFRPVKPGRHLIANAGTFRLVAETASKSQSSMLIVGE
jgi:hypothetical protein